MSLDVDAAARPARTVFLAPTVPATGAGRALSWAARNWWLTLSLLCLILWTPGVLSLPPLDRDESRFAQSSRQMLESGNFIDIRFGHVPRYKKPVGIYWLQSLTTAVAGLGDRSHIWTYRLPSLLGGLLAVLLCFWCARAFAIPEVSWLGAALMGTFVAKFKTVYNVSREGNMGNGRNILQRLGSPAPFPQSDADEGLLARQRTILLRARQDRVAPQRDDKVLADWNGLTITALANAGAAFNRADWTTAAIEAFDFVVKAMGDGDRLHHYWIGGSRGGLGFADDYAHMARAALALYETVGDKRYLDYAKRWTRILNEHHWDADSGGYTTLPNDADPLFIRTRPLFDQPIPAANSMMIQVIARLMMLSGENEHLERLNAIIGGFAGEAQRAFISMGSYYSALEFAMSALHLVVVGPLNHAKTHELTAAILGRALPNKLLSVVSPEETWPENHAMFGKGMQNGQPTAYICQRGQTSAPITNPVALSQMLQLPPQRPQPGQKPQ